MEDETETDEFLDVRQCNTCQRYKTKDEYSKFFYGPQRKCVRYLRACNDCYVRLMALESPQLNASLKKYGITFKDKVAMYKDQWEVCLVCRKVSDFFKLCVDHCHKTGKVRGLLCNRCNLALGLLMEDKSAFKRMGRYIKKHSIETDD